MHAAKPIIVCNKSKNTTIVDYLCQCTRVMIHCTIKHIHIHTLQLLSVHIMQNNVRCNRTVPISMHMGKRAIMDYRSNNACMHVSMMLVGTQSSFISYCDPYISIQSTPHISKVKTVHTWVCNRRGAGNTRVFRVCTVMVGNESAVHKVSLSSSTHNIINQNGTCSLTKVCLTSGSSTCVINDRKLTYLVNIAILTLTIAILVQL